MSILTQLLVELLGVVSKVPRNPVEQLDILDAIFHRKEHSIDAQSQKNDNQSILDNSTINQAKQEGKVQQEIFIVVHNLEYLPKTKCTHDSSLCCMPHSNNAMGVLARLVQYGNIHLIASIDNINSGFIFNSHLLSYFNFINFKTPNPYSRYNLEIRAMGFSRDICYEGVQAKAVVSVYNSLTRNAQKIFEMIVKYHQQQFAKLRQDQQDGPKINMCLNSKQDKARKKSGSNNNDQNQITLGIFFDDLFKDASKQFLVRNRNSLRNLLVEFRDHKLIYSENKDRNERIVLKLSEAVQNEFCEILGI